MVEYQPVPRTLGQALGQAVKQARLATPKWSQSKLATEAGVSRDVVWRLEHGGEVRWENAEAIARRLDGKTGGHILGDLLNSAAEAEAPASDKTREPREPGDAEAATMAQSNQRLDDLRAVLANFERLFRSVEGNEGEQQRLITTLEDFYIAQRGELHRKLRAAGEHG